MRSSNCSLQRKPGVIERHLNHPWFLINQTRAQFKDSVSGCNLNSVSCYTINSYYHVNLTSANETPSDKDVSLIQSNKISLRPCIFHNCAASAYSCRDCRK